MPCAPTVIFWAVLFIMGLMKPMLAAIASPPEDNSLFNLPNPMVFPSPQTCFTGCRLRSQTLSLAGREGKGYRSLSALCLWRMKTRSQTGPKPLKTVALGPRPSSPKQKARSKPTGGKGAPGAPKKPPTAFFYFMEDFRKTYKKENPNVKTMQEVGKACGEKWNTMPFEEKVKYYDIATEKRAEFEKAMAEYNKKKKRGELAEESDDD